MQLTLTPSVVLLGALTLLSGYISGCNAGNGELEIPIFGTESPETPTPEAQCLAADISAYFPDADGDGFGDPTEFVEDCIAPEGYTRTGGDCADSDAAVKPGAVELCDSKDNDCDGAVDENVTYYLDADHDGYGDSAQSVEACGAPRGYKPIGGDCDDGDALVLSQLLSNLHFTGNVSAA